MCHCSERAVGCADRGARVTNFSHKVPLIDHMSAVESPRAHFRSPWSAAALLAFTVLGAACGNNDTTTTTPTTPTAPPSPATEILSGTMAPNGTATRTFTASKSGTVSVTLTAAGPPSSIVLGLGLGIRAATGLDCEFTTTVNTPAGAAAQLTATVDAGTYCAGAYDIGNVGPGGVTVTVSVTHP
jgi:hypothetical protein